MYVKVYFRYDDNLEIEKTPLQRFYRYVLKSSLTFKKDGSQLTQGASFGKVPADPLLTLGMDGES